MYVKNEFRIETKQSQIEHIPQNNQNVRSTHRKTHTVKSSFYILAKAIVSFATLFVQRFCACKERKGGNEVKTIRNVSYFCLVFCVYTIFHTVTIILLYKLKYIEI